jgi:endonuclease YncB( thermonuclease family)
MGAFRFCTGCQLDFDAIGTTPGGAPATVGTVAAAPSLSRSRFSRRGLLVAGLAVVVGLAALGSIDRTDTGSPTSALASATPTARAVAAATATPTAKPTLTPEATFGPIGQTTEATVVRITDGDTIVVAYGGKEYKVRYIGMDSPETVDPSSPIQWMGPQATAANAALVAGKTVFLEKDVSEVDRFNRLLRYVWLTNGTAWTLVNLELVRQGVASAKSYPPDTKYDALYLVAQGEAHRSALGLWGPPPELPTPAPTPEPIIVPFVDPEPEPASECHPSYEPCLPIVADMNCPAVRAMGAAPVTVIGPDEYRLDGNHDGIGCE